MAATPRNSTSRTTPIRTTGEIAFATGSAAIARARAPSSRGGAGACVASIVLPTKFMISSPDRAMVEI
jgi:hypothetical protein